MFSYLFFYKMLFAAEILVAEFLFTFRLKKRSRFPLRFALCAAACIIIAAFFPDGPQAFWYSSITFLCIFAFTFAALVICYEEPFGNILFCGMAAYSTQHFSYGLANIALSLIMRVRSPLNGMYVEDTVDFGWNGETALVVLSYVICYFVSYWALYAIFARRIKKGSNMKIKSMSLLVLIGIGLLIDIVLSSVVMSADELSMTVDAVYNVTNMLCCFLLLYSQFSLLQNKEKEDELAFVNRMWHQEKEQYAISKETIDLINMKCHDMRHQIREIGKNKSFPDEAIREMESTISIYDSIVKTGNEALDTILTEKSLRCNRSGIIFTCVADGALLDFMNATDLYSLFGNALDNAIEAAGKVSDPDRRVIGLKINRVGEMASVNVKNSFEGYIKYDEHGYPETTKEDSDYHGYGIKSIAYIVEKYDGNLSIAVKENIFNLNVLLPLPI